MATPALPAVNGNGPGGTLRPAHSSALRVGDPVPPFTLPDLNGKAVPLAAYQGRSTLLLFWNPGCSFCQHMLPALKEWEDDPPEEAPDMLVVATGTRKE